MDEVGDAFGGVEASNLDEVFLERPFELSPVRVLDLGTGGERRDKGGKDEDEHSDSVALFVVDVAIVALIPLVHVLVETIEPDNVSNFYEVFGNSGLTNR